MHQLANELNLGKNGLVWYVSKKDLLVVARSKQLLINSITCWNMLRITQKLTEASPAERKEILTSLTYPDPLSWKYINFQPGRRAVRFGKTTPDSRMERVNRG